MGSASELPSNRCWSSPSLLPVPQPSDPTTRIYCSTSQPDTSGNTLFKLSGRWRLFGKCLSRRPGGLFSETQPVPSEHSRVILNRLWLIVAQGMKLSHLKVRIVLAGVPRDPDVKDPWIQSLLTSHGYPNAGYLSSLCNNLYLHQNYLKLSRLGESARSEMF